MKAGECFRYGCIQELLNEKNDKMEYLQSLYLYLFLERKISLEAMMKLKVTLEARNCFYSISRTEILKEAVRVLSRELKKIMQFQNFEEFSQELDEFEIPDWIIKGADELFSYAPQLYKKNDILFYICRKENRNFFRKIRISRIEMWCRSGVTKSIWKESGEFQELSEKYSRMLGWNDVADIIYLEVADMEQLYAEYHLEIGQEVIVHEKFWDISGEHILVEKGKRLFIKKEEKYKEIKETSVLETYTLKGERILVRASRLEPIVFRPFWMNLDGEISDISDEEAVEYLESQLFDKESLYAGKLLALIKEKGGKGFTLQNLIMLFRSVGEIVKEAMADFTLTLLCKLSSVMDADTNMLEYFYVLLDATKKYKESSFLELGFSEEICELISEMERTGRLRTCLDTPQIFRKVLMEYVYWNEERLKEREKGKFETGKVGCFIIDNKRIQEESIPLEEGICIGNLIVFPERRKKGMVSYQLDTKKFLIQYPKILAKSEIDEIVYKFGLKNYSYQVIIEPEL